MTMQEDAKQSKKEAAANAAKSMESKLASATSALEKAPKETNVSLQGRLDSLDTAIKKVVFKIPSYTNAEPDWHPSTIVIHNRVKAERVRKHEGAE